VPSARGLAGAVVTAVAAVACTLSVGSRGPGVSPVPASTSPSRVPTGPGSSAAEMASLCVPPKTGSRGTPKPAATTPSAIATVEHEVESVRGLRYERPVSVDAVTPAGMDRRLTRSFDDTYPRAFYDRRTLAWRALGVIPPDADIRSALLAFQTGQVVGFYDPNDGALVYIGSATQMGLEERLILAHELTHAIDDQHFDLERLNPIARSCHDESFQAALGAVEGSAQYFATQVIVRFPQSVAGGAGGGAGAPGGVPPFITAMELFPYSAGQAFMAAMAARGGTAAQNDALRHFPVSTEQVIHPQDYPNDLPQPVDVPELGGRMGKGWKDIDVMQVGEEFLREMLRLRLDSGTADAAAAGWGGGTYRAWSDGTHTAVVLATVWDTPGDAQAFAQAMQDWLNAGTTPASILPVLGSRVTVVFSDDPAAVAALRAHA
jgi:hypothetical protein